MAVAHRATSTAFEENSDNVTITKPTGLTAGDLMIALVGIIGETADWNTPTGWTLKGSQTTLSDVSGRVACFVKKADSSDASATDFTFTHSVPAGTRETGGFIIALSGTFADVNNITAFTIEYDADGNDNDILEFETGITPLANAFLVMGAFLSCVNAGSTAADTFAITTSNPTWTERADAGDITGDDRRVCVATASRPETTSTGAWSIDFSSASANVNGGVGILLAVHETANVTVTPDPITHTLTVPAPTVAANANVSAGVVTHTLSLPAPTVTITAQKWRNTDKSSTATFTNPDKS